MSPLTNFSKLAVSLAMFAIFIGASALTVQADPVTLINGGSSVAIDYAVAPRLRSSP
jgi:hypothetical protein